MIEFQQFMGPSPSIKLRNWYLQTSKAKPSKELNATFKQEILGRNNRLLSSDQSWTA
jgi:hypothetical protein